MIIEELADGLGQALPLLMRLAKEAVGTEERMEQRWWQCVVENAGDQELLKNPGQRAVMGDSSAKAELDLWRYRGRRRLLCPTTACNRFSNAF